MAIETLAGLIKSAGHELPAVPPRHLARFRADSGFAPGVGLGGGYEGASYGRRTVGWQAGNYSVNSALLFAGETLRARSRDLIRRNSWAFGGIETYVAEAIGSGIIPRSQHPDPAKRDLIQTLFTRWTDFSDADGIQDFYGQQKMVASSIKQGGEVLVRLRPRLEKDGMTVPLQLQILEAEHMPMNWNESPAQGSVGEGNLVFAGVERNLIGQRVAYWLYPRHPGEVLYFNLSPNDQFVPKRIPAVGFPSYISGVLHCFEPIRPGQLRGEPSLARVLLRINDIDKYTDAEVVRKQTAALYAGFITENSPDDPLNQESSVLPDGSAATAPSGVAFAGLEPGTMQKLHPGETVTFSEPADVGANFDVFLRSSLREIAKGMGITYEQLTGDLSSVNYSSIRAGLLEFRRKCEQFQNFVIIFQFCRPVWRAFIEAAVLGGEISAADYNANQADYLAVKWIAPGWAWVDPEKDIAAVRAAIRNGLSTRSMETSARGFSSEDIDRENAADKKRADELDLIYDSDPSVTAGNGARPDPRDPGNPDGIEGSGTPKPAQQENPNG